MNSSTGSTSGTTKSPPGFSPSCGRTFARISFCKTAIEGAPLAAPLITASITSCKSVLRTTRPSTTTRCCFRATLWVSFLRLTAPLGRPRLLPDVPFRNRCSAGGGVWPGPSLGLSFIFKILQKLVVKLCYARLVALVLCFQGGVDIGIPGWQTIGIEEHFHDSPIHAPWITNTPCVWPTAAGSSRPAISHSFRNSLVARGSPLSALFPRDMSEASCGCIVVDLPRRLTFSGLSIHAATSRPLSARWVRAPGASSLKCLDLNWCSLGGFL